MWIWETLNISLKIKGYGSNICIKIRACDNIKITDQFNRKINWNDAKLHDVIKIF